MVEADCSLTHSDTNCSEAVFAYVMAIRDLIHGKNATVRSHKHKKNGKMVFHFSIDLKLIP